MHPYAHSSIIYNNEVLQTPYMPISEWVDQKTGTFTPWNTRKKEGSPTFCDSMDGTG